ncbi:uncharacterized protein METZ01_LOCUS459401 [marine metagenome]|uniref:Uncharacterized protein n=1 Tax=marine metagenome TaxID=408172 RepID=A0A383AFF4_9ZZZZ
MPLYALRGFSLLSAYSIRRATFTKTSYLISISHLILRNNRHKVKDFLCIRAKNFLKSKFRHLIDKVLDLYQAFVVH